MFQVLLRQLVCCTAWNTCTTNRCSRHHRKRIDRIRTQLDSRLAKYFEETFFSGLASSRLPVPCMCPFLLRQLAWCTAWSTCTTNRCFRHHRKCIDRIRTRLDSRLAKYFEETSFSGLA